MKTTYRKLAELQTSFQELSRILKAPGKLRVQLAKNQIAFDDALRPLAATETKLREEHKDDKNAVEFMKEFNASLDQEVELNLTLIPYKDLESFDISVGTIAMLLGITIAEPTE